MMQTNSVDQVKTSAPRQALPAFFLMAAMTALYFLGQFVKPGLVTYAISAVALAVILITALARVNDITIELTGGRWHVRRFGLVLAGAGASALLASPLMTGDYPSWREVMLEAGVALTWFTTPGMPPWWRFIAGKHQ